MAEESELHPSANFIMNVLSLASMMDERGMVFVTNAIFFESLCCFPVQGEAFVCCAEPTTALL